MTTLKERVAARLDALGLSPYEAAMKARLHRSYVSDILRDKKHRMTVDFAGRLAKVLECDPQWLASGTGPAPPDGSPPASAVGGPSDVVVGFGPPLPESGVTGEVRRADVALPPLSEMPRDVPVYGTAAGSVVGAFQFDGVVDYVRRPPALMGVPVAYALYITGSSMEPEHNPGDLRFIHPGRPPRIGDTVIVQTKNHEADGITAYIKTLVRMNDAKVFLHQRNPEATIELDRRTVVAVHRVLTLNELFGV